MCVFSKVCLEMRVALFCGPAGARWVAVPCARGSPTCSGAVEVEAGGGWLRLRGDFRQLRVLQSSVNAAVRSQEKPRSRHTMPLESASR